jgi:ABC-type antimicrobial peptide transport system permease subunit
MVTTHYFRTLGMRIVEGRGFDQRDAPQTARVVILSQGLARRLWPSGGAVGRRLVVDYSTSGTYPYDVVGVREVLRELDPRKPAHGIQALDDLLGATYSRDRQAMQLLSAFAAVTVLLSLLGVQGILSNRVRERTREIGIRMAVGADRLHLLRWIAGHGLKLTLIGVVLGSTLAAASARVLSGLLFGVSVADPAAAMAVAALPLIAFAVSLHPAWRATRIQTAEVLRAG